MSKDHNILLSFINCLQRLDFEGMRGICGNGLQYFDPLYGYLKKEEVVNLWRLKYEIDNIQIVKFDQPENLGEGYYKFKCNIRYGLKIAIEIEQPLQFHCRVENGLITEYSEAFSLHKMAQIHSPFLGWLLGWNKYYQNRMKIKARKRLFDLMKEE